MGTPSLLLAAFMLISSAIDTGQLYQTFRLEQRWKLTRCRALMAGGNLLKSTLLGAVIQPADRRSGSWARQAGCRWLWAWGAWMGFNLLLMVVFGLHRAASSASSSRWRTNPQGRVTAACSAAASRDEGRSAWTAAAGSARQLPFTGFRRGQARGFLTRALPAALAPEGRGRARASWAISFNAPLAGMITISLAGFALLGWLSTRSWFYGAGRAAQPRFYRALIAESA